jgi:hypothetical protein
MTLPEGQVHQCNEGHCYCVDCWNRLDPRRCPECRLEVPLLVNRCRAAERAIAALEASCDHCGEATTRGAMAAHLPSARVCPQRPNFCAAAAGCRWKGLAAEQAAHEAACPFAICQRMMAPMQAQNQQLQTECQELRALVAAQNEQLQGRVRALEGDEEVEEEEGEEEQESEEEEESAAEGAEEGGRRQRQRVGAAPHDAPPSDEELEEMELEEVAAALRAHVAVARVAEEACERLADLCEPDGSEQAAAEAGAIEAVVAAMRAHRQVADVQDYGCRVLASVCFGDGAATDARCQRVAAAGAIEEVVAALRAHLRVAGVQLSVQVDGCCALGNRLWRRRRSRRRRLAGGSGRRGQGRSRRWWRRCGRIRRRRTCKRTAASRFAASAAVVPGCAVAGGGRRRRRRTNGRCRCHAGAPGPRLSAGLRASGAEPPSRGGVKAYAGGPVYVQELAVAFPSEIM